MEATAARRHPGRPLGVGLVLAVLVFAPGGHAREQAQNDFASLVTRLSEGGGYFDTDNLISNERTFLSVLPALREAGAAGGAYLGVGPDQNFSYIAHVRPSIAFLVDVRRDNLLLHLLFKALFAVAETRAEYAALLFGRAPPPPDTSWLAAGVDDLLAYIDRAPREPIGGPRIDAAMRSFGVSLSADDLQTVRRFHQTFAAEGLSLKFTTHGRAPRPIYPTYRDLLAATDPAGRPASFLASEELFLVVRSLHNRNLIIPVVGDLAGPTALAAIGRVLEERGERLSVAYVSNVEQYVAGAGKLNRYLDNLARLPHSPRSVLIRAHFSFSDSRSSVQRIDDLLDSRAAGRIRFDIR